MGRILRWTCIAATFLLCLSCVDTEALARAGGGGGYSGGGGGYSGGGGGGGGGGGEAIFLLIRLLIQLCFYHPIIGIPVTIGVIALVVYYAKENMGSGSSNQTRVIRQGNLAVEHQRVRTALNALKHADPAFDTGKMDQRVESAFCQIQDAWSRQDLQSIRAFVSDGIYERFKLQIMEQKDLGYRNVMENVRVHSMQICRVLMLPPFDEITLRIQASATDYRVNLSDNKEIPGYRRDEHFVEYWSFIRRKGAKTSEGDGLIEGFCPNCGVDIRMNQSAKCEACDSLVRSGRYDWVLSEITQASAWPPAHEGLPPGATAYRSKKDPAFNVQHLEDRASVVFWRKSMADRLNSVDPLRKVALPTFCDSFKVGAGGKHVYTGDCAVGAVDTVGVLSSENWDRALAVIHWSGREFHHEEKRWATNHSVARRHIFVLARKSGVQSVDDHAISSSHCPGCGAPESDVASSECEYCGIALGDGSSDWCLEAIYPWSDATAQQLINEATRLEKEFAASAGGPEVIVADMIVEDPRGEALLAWAIKMALANHDLDQREEKVIRKTAKTLGVKSARVDEYLAAARNGQLEVSQPGDKDEASRWLMKMIDIALADGKVDRAEAEVLTQAGEQFGYMKADIKLMYNRRRNELFQAAKQRRSQITE